jgi:hypothetical protein
MVNQIGKLLFPRLPRKHRRRRMKLLIALVFAILAVCGIVLAGIHQLKKPVGAPPTPLSPNDSN